jgi:SAM-dependent methyltransferase
MLEQVHNTLVYGRRVRALVHALSPLLPANATVLDVGCGDGLIDTLIMQGRPDVRVSGIDVLVRSRTSTAVVEFDGRTIPYGAASYDAVLMIDVLHHADSPRGLLEEATRVARDVIVIKDHVSEGWLDDSVLRLMDWVGNAHHGVSLPYRYWSRRQWRESFAELGLAPRQWNTKIGLYPWPFNWVFERSLHFIAQLTKAQTGIGSHVV